MSRRARKTPKGKGMSYGHSQTGETLMAKRPRACSMLSRDIERLGAVTANFADGVRITGAGFGPPGRRLLYRFKCAKEGKWGPGPCSVYEITRKGAGARGLRSRTTTGNLYGLVRQISRDIVRSWGCIPGPEVGFEGARRRRR